VLVAGKVSVDFEIADFGNEVGTHGESPL